MASGESLARLGMFLFSREDLPLIADTSTLARTRARDLVKRVNARRNERLTETQRAEVDHLRFASVEQVEYLLARVEVRNDRLYRLVKPSAKQSAKADALQYILWEDLRSDLAAAVDTILRDPERTSLAGWKMPLRKMVDKTFMYFDAKSLPSMKTMRLGALLLDFRALQEVFPVLCKDCAISVAVANDRRHAELLARNSASVEPHGELPSLVGDSGAWYAQPHLFCVPTHYLPWLCARLAAFDLRVTLRRMQRRSHIAFLGSSLIDAMEWTCGHVVTSRRKRKRGPEEVAGEALSSSAAPPAKRSRRNAAGSGSAESADPASAMAPDGRRTADDGALFAGQSAMIHAYNLCDGTTLVFVPKWPDLVRVDPPTMSALEHGWTSREYESLPLLPEARAAFVAATGAPERDPTDSKIAAAVPTVLPRLASENSVLQELLRRTNCRFVAERQPPPSSSTPSAVSDTSVFAASQPLHLQYPITADGEQQHSGLRPFPASSLAPDLASGSGAEAEQSAGATPSQLNPLTVAMMLQSQEGLQNIPFMPGDANVLTQLLSSSGFSSLGTFHHTATTTAESESASASSCAASVTTTTSTAVSTPPLPSLSVDDPLYGTPLNTEFPRNLGPFRVRPSAREVDEYRPGPALHADDTGGVSEAMNPSEGTVAAAAPGGDVYFLETGGALPAHLLRQVQSASSPQILQSFIATPTTLVATSAPTASATSTSYANETEITPSENGGDTERRRDDRNTLV